MVIDLGGLVTYLGLHTREPAAVAEALLSRDEVELVTYQQRDQIIVKSHRGAAAIDYRAGRFRYTAIDGDPLGYAGLADSWRQRGKTDGDGFIADEDWFPDAVDLGFPDGPRRLWDAFHGQVVNPPDVMLTLRDGFCAGDQALRRFITMQSTHGGLNQINSATFLLTMTGRAAKPLRSGQVIPTIEPSLDLTARARRF